jgi:hypothetical protein
MIGNGGLADRGAYYQFKDLVFADLNEKAGRVAAVRVRDRFGLGCHALIIFVILS